MEALFTYALPPPSPLPLLPVTYLPSHMSKRSSSPTMAYVYTERLLFFDMRSPYNTFSPYDVFCFLILEMFWDLGPGAMLKTRHCID